MAARIRIGCSAVLSQLMDQWSRVASSEAFAEVVFPAMRECA
jgi:hypothetical protein